MKLELPIGTLVKNHDGFWYFIYWKDNFLNFFNKMGIETYTNIQGPISGYKFKNELDELAMLSIYGG